MKIFIACSTSAYQQITTVKSVLESQGHEIITPNGYNAELIDTSLLSKSEYEHFFANFYYLSKEKINSSDAILVLNHDKIKNGITYHNYIGASTFLEMYEAFMDNKKIYIYRELPNSILIDEIKGFAPIVINEDLSKIK